MNITQCLHTAILITDLVKSEQFYSEVLGLEKIERNLKYPGLWYQIGNYQIHLMVDPKFQPRLSNSEKWGRNPHIAFSVTDLNRVRPSYDTFSNQGNSCLAKLSWNPFKNHIVN
jgi:glyoxylase I family protein